MKINKILITFFTLTIIANNYVVAQGYYVDPKAYEAARRTDVGREMYKQLTGIDLGSRAQDMLNDARMQYEINMANQAGVPYDEYLWQQQYMNTMNNYSNALQNQHMTIDANVNYSGTVNVNNYNHYKY